MRRLLVLAAVLALACCPAAAADLADETALAQRHAPVVRLVEQAEECGHGEPYRPTDVDLLFDEPTVALRGPWNAVDLVKVGPTANDIAGLYEYHLDFPGNALNPGCSSREPAPARGPRAGRLLARRDRPGAPGEAGAGVLALLRLQRLEQPARRQLGDDADPLRRRRCQSGAGEGRSPSASASTRAPRRRTGTTRSSSSSTGAGRSSTRPQVRTRTSSTPLCTSAAPASRASAATTPAGRTSSSSRR